MSHCVQKRIATSTTQTLINARCLIERELTGRHFRLSRERNNSGAVIVTNIPRGHSTIDVYNIMAEYGAIRRIAWMKDKEGRELNIMKVVYWNREVCKHLRKNGLYLTKEYREFRDKVHLE